jgi:hypothetical protein
MKEPQLRDLVSLNISKLESGLTLLQKEQYIPNEFGTRGFVDLYAKDEADNHVLIELKRSNTSSREALHEVTKYVEGVKRHFGVKDDEIRVIVASTEWTELLVPFSRFAEDATFSLRGYEVIVTDDNSNFDAKPVQTLPLSQGRFIAPWHEMYWYADESSFENGICSIQSICQEKGINDYVLAKIYLSNELNAEERKAAMRASVAQMIGIDESEVSSFPEIPVYKYIAYVGLQLLTKEKYMQILSSDSSAIEEVRECLHDMDEEEALCFLHESVKAMNPRPQCDSYEIGYPAKFEKLINGPSCEILSIIRNGSFSKNTLLSDETIISELRGEDGSTGQRFKKSVFISNVAHTKILQREIASCLSENPIWRTHILRIIDDIKIEFPDSEVEVSIYNPCTGIFTIYYVATKENGVLYIPSYHIIVQTPSDTRMYYGALEKSGEALSFTKILDKYYEGNLNTLLFSLTWGGKDSRDSDIVEDLGVQYRSFRCDVDGENRTFYALRDNKWRACGPVNPIGLFFQYLEHNEKLVRQIVTRIQARDMGAFFNLGSSPLSLDELVDMDRAEKHRVYYANAPLECDICSCSLENEKYMIDGKVQDYGVWACMCSDCFNSFGENISWGKGQLYLRNNKGWLLVSGFADDFEVKVD